MSGRTSFKELRAVPSMRALMGGGLVDSIGTGTYFAGGVVYFTKKLDLTAAQVGLGISVGSLLAALSVVWIGRVADRLGVGRTLVALQVWSALAFLSFLLVDSFWAFVLVACLVAIPERGWPSLATTVVGAVVPQSDRTDALAVMRVLRNTGFAVGGLLAAGGLSLGAGWALSGIMVVNAVSFGSSAALLLAMGVTGRKVAEAVARLRGGDEGHASVSWRARVPYLKVAALDSVCCLHMSLLGLGIPLVITLRSGLPSWAIAGMYVLNTGLAVTFQRRVSGALKGSVGAARTSMRATFLLLAATCVLVAVLPEVPVGLGFACLALTVLVLTGAELTQAASAWTLAFGLAPRDGSAEVYATFDLGFSAQLIFGPLLLSAVVARGGTYWVALAAGLVLLVPLVGPVVNNAQRSRAQEHASTP